MVQAHNVRAVSPQLAPGPDRLINGVLTEGVWDLPAGHYAVSQQPVAAMSVRVGSGTAYDKAVVQGDSSGQGVYIAENQDAYSGSGNADVAIANGGAQGRIDLVVLQISDDEFDSSGTWGAEVVVVQGAEAASPSAPAVPDSALPLAEVAVAAGLDSGITDAMITDRRVPARVGLPVGAPDGSASAPSITFEGDPDTGLARPAGNTLDLVTAGTVRQRIQPDGQALFTSGSVESPGISFLNDGDTGMRDIGGNNLEFVVGGQRGMILLSNKALRLDAIAGQIMLTFEGDPDTGLRYNGANDLSIYTGGAERLRVNSTLFAAPQVQSNTTASAANVFVSGSGLLQRSTSIRAAKTAIRALRDEHGDDGVASIARALTPVAFKSLLDGDDPDIEHVGLVAEDTAAADPRLVTFDEDGAPDGVSYDRVGVLAIAAVQVLLDRVDELEARLAAVEA